MRLDPRVADQRERVARGAAFGVMVDDDVGGHAPASRPALAPSLRPMVLSFLSIAISSMLSLQQLQRVAAALWRRCTRVLQFLPKWPQRAGDRKSDGEGKGV